MKCRLCGTDKLSKEFPRESVSDGCQHPPLYCLRCVTAEVKKTAKCPYVNCGLAVPEDSQRMREYEATLEYLFPSITADYPDLDLDLGTEIGTSDHVIHVATLTGDTASFKFDQQMKVAVLKQKIATEMKVPADKQRLVYSEQELESYKVDGQANSLADYNVKPFATVHLMVLLYSIPERLNHVIFDLSWGYPAHGRDFLDASALLFSNNVWYMYIDWREKQTRGVNGSKCIWHSGDVMDDKHKIGHHTIEAKLKEIPRCVSHVFFTLGSWKAPTIASFRNPGLKFYDAVNKDVSLCETKFDHVLHAQSVVVCCLSRVTADQWRIFNCGQATAGNAADTYRKIETTLQGFIRTNMYPGVALEQGVTLLHTMNAKEQEEYNKECEKRMK